jgi:APA family basic amino acid/polyamine antiporter
VIIGVMTVFSIFVFRWKRPDAPRPYRCWGYPIVPLLYCGISIWMLYETFLNRLDKVAIGIGSFSVALPAWFTGISIFILGIPIYFLWVRFYRQSRVG